MNDITLSYRLSPRWNKLERKGCEGASSEELYYEMFLGDIILRVGDADFSSQWGWVPILDLVRQFVSAGKEVAKNRKIDINFTESNALLTLTPRDGLIAISSTYSPSRQEVRVEDLQIAMKQFAKEAIREFDLLCPGLRENPLVRGLVL